MDNEKDIFLQSFPTHFILPLSNPTPCIQTYAPYFQGGRKATQEV